MDGLLTRKPTSIGVESILASSRQAILSLRMLRPSQEFRDSCRAILIYTYDADCCNSSSSEDTDDGSQQRLLLVKQMEGTELEQLQRE